MNEAKARRYYGGPVTEISVAKNATIPNIVIRLAKTSVVSGTVRDADGQPVPSAQKQNPAVPESVDALVSAMLAKAPSDRPPGAAVRPGGRHPPAGPPIRIAQRLVQKLIDKRRPRRNGHAARRSSRPARTAR
jgi:hypothetical protein